MFVSILGSRSFSSVLAIGHSRHIGRQFLPMLLSLPGIRIGMIIALCHTSGICPVEINRLKMSVRYLMASSSIFLRWRVLVASDSKAVDELANRIASFVSASVENSVPVNGR